MQTRPICMFSFQSLKFAPLRTGTEFRLADIDIEATTDDLEADDYYFNILHRPLKVRRNI